MQVKNYHNMLAKIFLFLLPLISYIGAQEDDVASAQKQIKEIEATAIRQAVIALEMPTEAAEYITRSFERFQEELKEISDASIGNVQTEAQAYTVQAIANRPLSVFSCISKAKSNGYNNIEARYQEYDDKLTANHQQALDDIEKASDDLDLIHSSIEGIFTIPSAEVESCKDSACAEGSIKKAQKLFDNIIKHLDVHTQAITQTRINFNQNQVDHLDKGRAQMQSAEATSIRSMRYC